MPRTATESESRRRVVWALITPPNDMSPTNPIDVADKLKAPVLGLYGGKDQGIPMEGGEDAGSAEGGRFNRPLRLSRASWLPRRLPRQLSRSRREGRLAAHADLVQEARRSVDLRSGRRFHGLRFEQVPVQSGLRDEVRMRPLLRDPAFLEHEDSIRAFDCREAMGNDNRRRTSRQVVECFRQLTFRNSV